MIRNALGAATRTLAAFLVVVSHTAQSAAKVPELDVKPIEVREISDLGAAITIPVNPAKDTYIEFPRDIRDTNSPQSKPFFEVAHRYDLLRIRLDENAAVGSKGSVHVDTASGRHSLLLQVVDQPEDAIGGLVLTLGSDSKQMHAEIASHMADFKTRYIQLEKKRSAALKRYAARMAAARVMAGVGYLVPATQRVTSESAADVRVRIDGGVWDKQDFIAAFVLTNDRMQPYRAAGIWAVDADGHRTRAELVSVESPGESEDGPVIWVPPYQHARIVVAIPDAASGRFTSMLLQVAEPDGSNSTTGEAENWYEWSPIFRPMTPEQLEAKRREEEAKGRVSIDLQAIVGAIWLTDGMGGSAPDATMLTGLGVRATYGFNRYIALEGEAMAGQSGEASFADMTIDGMQGELTRTASLGRVQLGGVVRLGYRIIPTMRLGVGLQGAGYDSELMTATGPEPMMDSGLEFTTTLNFGAGLDVRLGEHFLAGIAFSGVQQWAEGLQAIEAGIHAGYAWKP